MVVDSRGQMKIQQMAFMILALFLFFTLVGLFFLRIEFGDLEKSSRELEKDSTISSLEVISNMPELNCDSRKRLCLDKDKLDIMSSEFGSDYELFWPASSVKIYIVYPEQKSLIECPRANCNYFNIFDNGQTNKQEYSIYVSICEKTKKEGYVYDNCDIGKLVVGVKILE